MHGGKVRDEKPKIIWILFAIGPPSFCIIFAFAFFEGSYKKSIYMRTSYIMKGKMQLMFAIFWIMEHFQNVLLCLLQVYCMKVKDHLFKQWSFNLHKIPMDVKDLQKYNYHFQIYVYFSTVLCCIAVGLDWPYCLLWGLTNNWFLF